VSFAIHFALSNFGVAEVVVENPFGAPEEDLDEPKVDFGAPKNDVMLVSVFGFFTSAGEDEGSLLALRFRGPLIGEDIGTMDWGKRRSVEHEN
jgi:hypothetical protein